VTTDPGGEAIPAPAGPGGEAVPATAGQWAAARRHLRAADPLLAELIDADPEFDPAAWMEQLPPLSVFGALVFQVLGQQLSVAATRGMLARLQEHFGGHIPEPVDILGSSVEELRTLGLSRRKGATLIAAATAFTDGTVTEDGLRAMTDEEVMATLTAIPGIGPWTVQGLLIIALGRTDVVLPGDLALRKAIQRVYGLDHLPTEPEVLAIAEQWRPYRSLATGYLFNSAFG
jgi:DNA-3-methyladenine glycosylase II